MEENNNNGFEMNPNPNQTNGQPVQTKKKSKIVPILVFIIMVLILALVLSLGNMYAMTKDYDNVFSMVGSMMSGKEDASQDESIVPDNSESETNIKEDENKDYIYKKESYTVEVKDYDYEDEIEIPYININSEDAKKVNQEIDKLYAEAIKTVEDEDKGRSYTLITYEYSVLHNMISVCLYKTDLEVPGGGFESERIVYNISLKDGKKLSLQEALGEFNLEVEDLNNKIKQKIKEDYKNEDTYVKEHYRTEDAYIKAFKYNIFNTYFKSETKAIIGVGAEHLYGGGHLEIDLVEEKNNPLEETVKINIGFYQVNMEALGNEFKGNGVKLFEDTTCLIPFGVTGQSFEGTYEVENNMLICKLTKLQGEYIADTKISIEYHFEIENSETLKFKKSTGEIGSVYSTLDQKEYKWENVNVFENDTTFSFED